MFTADPSTIVYGETRRDASLTNTDSFLMVIEQINGNYREIGEGFNPEVGFLQRDDYHQGLVAVLRRYRFPEVSWFRELRPHIRWQQF